MARRRWSTPDPWASESVLDAIHVVRAWRMERRGEANPRLETTNQLLLRLGFASVDEMREWAEGVLERGRAQSEEILRRRAAGEDM